MQNMSIRTRLFFGLCAVLLPALIATNLLFDRAVSRDLLLESQERAADQVHVVSWLLETHHGFEDMEALDTWASDLGRKMGVRITYIVDGLVVADSAVPYQDIPNLEFHGDRPEVLQAMDAELGMNVRYSRTLDRELIYAAKQQPATPTLSAGVLRLATPLSEVTAHQDEIGAQLRWIIIGVLAAALVVSILMSRAIARSIRGLALAARAIGRGEHGQRIRHYPSSEFRPLVHAINTMARDIESAMEDLEDQRGRLEAVFNGMSEGVMVVDSRGRIESFNRAMELMVPEVRGSIDRTPLEATMEPGLHQAVESLLKRPGTADTATVPLSSGPDKYMEVLLEPFSDPKGVRKVILLFRDVSEIKRLEIVRRDFVANVSHELRTPVTSIKGYAETLLDGGNTPPEMRRQFLEVIIRNADHMTAMVRKLLRLAQAEHKGAVHGAKAVDAAEILSGVIATLAPMLKDYEASIANPLSRPVMVLAEEAGLEEIFRNLLVNAIKFGPLGGKIHVDMARVGEWTRFSVRDQGPGVPPAEHERIFERFYRRRDEQGGKVEGTGLGLAICRHIVEGLGGKIWAEVPIGEGMDPDHPGAVFFFTLKTAS
ncbi:MAG: HAMP domain-containing protein [Desulfovibrio sp.]|nr:MAG: HAMP domain-containing protein [Desulfovibrio sp.]